MQVMHDGSFFDALRMHYLVCPIFLERECKTNSEIHTIFANIHKRHQNVKGFEELVSNFRFAFVYSELYKQNFGPEVTNKKYGFICDDFLDGDIPIISCSITTLDRNKIASIQFRRDLSDEQFIIITDFNDKLLNTAHSLAQNHTQCMSRFRKKTEC